MRVPLAAPLAEGQVWTFADATAETARVVIQLIEMWEDRQAIHVSVFGLSADPNPFTGEISHMPFDADTLAASLERLTDETPPVGLDIAEGYQSWKENSGGIFTVPLAAAVDMLIETAFGAPSPREPMKLVFIYGPAASGKLTVARELSALTGLPVFHNHLVVDALLAVFPFGDPAFVRLREEMWMSVFVEAANAGRSMIFTFAPEPTVEPGFPERVKAVWTLHGGEVDFVQLQVSAEVQEARIDAESRKAFHKLTSVELLRELRPQFAMSEAMMPAPAVSLDTGGISPQAAALHVASALGLTSDAT